MPWVSSRSAIRPFVRSSLAYCDLVEQPYVRRPDGSLRYDGERPSPGWHAHGWFPRSIRLIQGGRFVRKVVWKRRWKDPATGRTRHSRPPDEVGPVRWCVLGVLLTLWAVLDGAEGFERCRPVFEAMEDAVSPRTARRWLRRALRVADALQQAFRHEVIEKSEPRPVERFFPGGLSPPEGLLRRRWGAASAVVTLWRGLAFLLGGAVGLGVPAALLLAGARGRTSTPTGRWI